MLVVQVSVFPIECKKLRSTSKFTGCSSNCREMITITPGARTISCRSIEDRS